MRIATILLVLFNIPILAYSNTINVPKDYSTIQGAVDAAVNGDTILVAPGLYVENVSIFKKNVKLISTGKDRAIIDGNQTGSVVNFSGCTGPDLVLDGFQLQNGTGTDAEILPGHWSYVGGGINSFMSSPLIINNVITGNSAEHSGGGIDCSHSLTITNNIIFGNKAAYGGGIYSQGQSIISNNIIFGNKASQLGGGIECEDSYDTLFNNIIFKNHAGKSGGGVSCFSYSKTLLVNNTIVNNSAGSGGGMYSNYTSDPTIINSIFWGNSGSPGPEISVGYSTALTIRYSDVKGGKSMVHVIPGSSLNWGPGMMDSDPLFADPLNEDFHLTFQSPCIDAGDTMAAIDPFDFEGDPRNAYGGVDMGADEFSFHFYYTGDATPGANMDLKFVGTPNTAPVYLWLGSGILQSPMNLPPHGDWHLQFPILIEANLGAIPFDGILGFTCNIPSNIPIPLDLPLQAGIGSLLTNYELIEIR